ncbi:MAG: SGNH/GDSL hydrolase family protein [Propionibacteriaceae bacterium]|jgi:lysophospholipase L1-like esterase|nr:SGNH/GDSL hydrolase family protein [Propionibacteriaceae bacterium]
MASTHPWRSYVALGDSLTEGLQDYYPDGKPRGWADRLAQHLANRAGENVSYANLAVRGRLLSPILSQQVGPALDLQPDLVSIWGGGNDMLRVNSDPDDMAAQLGSAVRLFREAGVDVLLLTGIDTVDSPLIKLSRKRTALFNIHLVGIAEEYGARVVNTWKMASLRDFRLWYPDRIHLLPDGHERIAQAALVSLGLAPDSPDWDAPLPPEPSKTLPESARWHAHWLRNYVGPWLGRRIRKTSSGEHRSAKFPNYQTICPASASS